MTVTDTKGNKVTGTIFDNENIDWNNITTGDDTEDDTGVPTIIGNLKPQRWDSVNYNPGTLSTASVELTEGAEIENTKLARLSLPTGATLDSNVTANQATDWKVLDYDETTGDVLIISTNGIFAELTLEGIDGYNNAIEALDIVASIYKNSTYAKSARSITLDDVNNVEGYDSVITASGTASGNGELSNSLNYRYGMDENLNIVNYGEENEKNRTFVSTATTDSYSYTFNYLSSYLPSSTKLYWIASCCVRVKETSAEFSVRCS